MLQSFLNIHTDYSFLKLAFKEDDHSNLTFINDPGRRDPFH